MRKILIEAFYQQDFKWIQTSFNKWIQSPNIYQTLINELYICFILKSVSPHFQLLEQSIEELKKRPSEINTKDLTLPKQAFIKLSQAIQNEESVLAHISTSDIHLFCRESNDLNINLAIMLQYLYTHHHNLFKSTLQQLAPQYSLNTDSQAINYILDSFPHPYETFFIEQILKNNSEKKVHEWVLLLYEQKKEDNPSLERSIINGLKNNLFIQTFYQLTQQHPSLTKELIDYLIENDHWEWMNIIYQNAIQQPEKNIHFLEYFGKSLSLYNDKPQAEKLLFIQTEFYQALYEGYKVNNQPHNIAQLIISALNLKHFNILATCLEKTTNNSLWYFYVLKVCYLFFILDTIKHTKNIHTLAKDFINNTEIMDEETIEKIEQVLKSMPQKESSFTLTDKDLNFLFNIQKPLNTKKSITYCHLIYKHCPHLLPSLLPYLSFTKESSKKYTFQQAFKKIITNLSQKQSSISKLIQDIPEQRVLTDILPIYIHNDSKKQYTKNQLLIQSIQESLKKLNYFDTLYECYNQTHNINAIKDLVFNLFIKKEWKKIESWLQKWLQNIPENTQKIHFITQCFEFIHPVNLSEEFCLEFETHQNPLFQFYYFWEEHKKSIPNLSQLCFFYKQKCNLLHLQDNFHTLNKKRKKSFQSFLKQKVHPFILKENINDEPETIPLIPLPTTINITLHHSTPFLKIKKQA